MPQNARKACWHQPDYRFGPHRGVLNHFVVAALVNEELQVLCSLLQERLVREELALKDGLVWQDRDEVARVAIPQRCVQGIKVTESPLYSTLSLWEGAQGGFGLYLVDCVGEGDAHCG